VSTFGCVSAHRTIEARNAGDARNPIIGSLPTVLVGFFIDGFPNGADKDEEMPGYFLALAIALHWTHKSKC
jgi:hypothetical protein